MLDHLKVFTVAVEQQSMTGAAEALDMTVATVSRRISELEGQLGCALFHRSNKGLVLTPAGRAYYDETAGFIHELDLRLLNLDRSLNSLEGELSIMAPTNIGNGPLDLFWQSFVSSYPEIRMNVILDDPDANVIDRQVDIAIRSGPQQNSALIQQTLGSITPVLVAATGADMTLPMSVDELPAVPSIAAHLFSDWTLLSSHGKRSFHKQHIHISNDMTVTRNLVKAGAGIALLPMSMVYHDIQAGALTRILPSWSGVPREISLLWPKTRTLSARAQCFRRELIVFLKQQYWFNAAF